MIIPWTGGTAQALRRCPNWRHRVFSPKISYWKTTRPLDLLLKHLRISCLNILPVVRPSSFDDGFNKTKCRSTRARRLTNERERERQQNLQFEKRGHLFFLSVNINSKEKKNKRRGGQTDKEGVSPFRLVDISQHNPSDGRSDPEILRRRRKNPQQFKCS